QVQVYLGNGNGTFSQGWVGAGDVHPVVGDFNNDGILDFAGVGSASGTFNIWLGNGNGTFKKASSYSYGYSSNDESNVYDLNSDGKLDIITSGYDGTNGVFSVMLGNGTGSFHAP